MPKLNVQQNNQNVIQSLANGVAIGRLNGIIKCDGENNFSVAEAGGGGGRNLLDNPWFTVNQRGATTTSTNNEYIADRWLCTYGSGGFTATRESNGSITVTPSLSTSYGALCQKLNPTIGEYLIGKTVTGSVLLDNGTMLTGTATISGTSNVDIIARGAENINVVWGYANKQIDVRSYAEAHTIKAVKLELGSVSTLANDAPPDYGEELAKCQRYFYRISNTTNYAVFGTGHAASASVVYVFVPLPVTMRNTPGKAISTVGDFRLIGNGQSVSMTDIGVRYATPNGVTLQTSGSSGLTTYQTYSLVNIGTTAYIDFSADL